MTINFHLFGVEKTIFCPSVNSLAAPTRAELNAGVVVNNPGVNQIEAIAETSGFEASSTFIDIPNAATVFTGKIPGREEAGEPMIRVYEQKTGTRTKRIALAKGTVGFYVRMPYGDIPGDRCEVYPVTIASVNTSQLTPENQAASFEVRVAITAQPDQNAVIPAA